MIGHPIPKTVEGQSLLPVLKGSKDSLRESLFLAYTKLQRGVRTDENWKLIKYNVKGVQTTQLFNLNEDPFEMNNLVSDDRCRQHLTALTLLLKQSMNDLDDFCDLDKPNWGLPEDVHEKK